MIHTRRLPPLLAVSALLMIVGFAPLAQADVLPPNDCTGPVGSACSTAGPQFNQEGVCVTESCSSPSTDAPSACVLCELVDAGPAERDASAPDASPVEHPDTGTDASPTTTTLGSSSSCSASPARHTRGDGPVLPILAGVGLALSVVSRRRRRI